MLKYKDSSKNDARLDRILLSRKGRKKNGSPAIRSRLINSIGNAK